MVQPKAPISVLQYVEHTVVSQVIVNTKGILLRSVVILEYQLCNQMGLVNVRMSAMRLA